MTLAAGIVTLLLAATPAALAQPALQSKGLRVEVIDTHVGVEKGCAITRLIPDEAPRASGVVGLGVEGTDARGARCSGRGWARVRVFAPVWVTTRAVRSGESLDGAVVRVEKELGANLSPLPAVAVGALARTSLAKGLVLEPRHVRDAGPGAGEHVLVVVELGAVRLEQDGVLVSCARPCARLANGRRVEGALVDGKLVVTP